MALKDKYDFSVVINDAEKLVIQEIEAQLSSKEMEDEEFVMDVTAYALNHVPPLYRANLLGKLYHDNIDGTEYDRKVKNGVKEAIARIRSNPS